MKKLNKLQINPERIMNNDELITLKGGYDWEPIGCCFCWDRNMDPVCGMAAYGPDDCMQNCFYAGNWLGFYTC